MKKRIKYGIMLVVALVLAYNSVYFKSLSEVKATPTADQFDATTYANEFWSTKLTPGLGQAVEINTLVAELETDKDAAFAKHSHALGIGNIRYFMIRGEGEITTIGENTVTVVAKTDQAQQPVKIETEFVYGNAVRDAQGLIDLTEFTSTMHLNSVSEEINRKIRTEVVPPFKANAQKGQRVQFVGAIELNQEHLRLDEIEVIPVALDLVEPEGASTN
ncbi:DUF2291 domain-containing protein [Pontibacter beigongshangensis]|uniref:DUF2291 domain-containing protein n=1 Tax=Pontibacter beigongshangensis TaxID=2574733 RepID=UPI00164F007A|nr:DUF2291 domain-containing protein [Pontibacter beigongshangensis]